MAVISFFSSPRPPVFFHSHRVSFSSIGRLARFLLGAFVRLGPENRSLIGNLSSQQAPAGAVRDDRPYRKMSDLMKGHLSVQKDTRSDRVMCISDYQKQTLLLRCP